MIESSTKPSIPTVRHIASTAKNLDSKMRKTRMQTCLTLSAVITATQVLVIYIKFMVIQGINLETILFGDHFNFGLLLICDCFVVFLVWKVFTSMITNRNNRATELYFSDQYLTVNYTRLKNFPDLVVPLSAIDEIRHESSNDDDMIVLSFNDGKVEYDIHKAIKSHFGNGILFGSPSWLDSGSNRWVLSIYGDPPLTEVVSLIRAWRNYAIYMPPMAPLFPAKPENETIAETPALDSKRDDLIDVNTAGYDALMSLPGMGVVEAKRLIEYRQLHGFFNTIDAVFELLLIKPHHAKQWKVRVFVSMPPNSPMPDSEPADDVRGRTVD